MQLPPAADILSGVLAELALVKPLVPTYTHLLLSAVFPIFIGSHASLTRPSSAAKPDKKRTADGQLLDDDDDDEEDAENTQKMEGLAPSDAIMFPIMSGLTLASLYLLIKALKDPSILSRILNWYFSLVGFFFTIGLVRDVFAVLRSVIFPSRYSMEGVLWKVDQEAQLVMPVTPETTTTTLRPRNSPLPGSLGNLALPAGLQSGLWSVRKLVYRSAVFRLRVLSKVDIKTRFTILDVASIIVSMITTGIFALLPRTWMITNFLGFCFCYGSLQVMSPTTFWTGTLILSSLFLYDIYFVFFTPMMVTVAQKLDVPIKLLFPRPPPPGQDPDLASLAMLGLGDIVVPGVMIGLALRFDLYLHYLRLKSDSAGESDKPQYVKATGGWGERLWTSTSAFRGLPVKETTYLSSKTFPKTYFRNSMIGYVTGMLTTLLAMQISSHPQPALLYLVPGVLLSIWSTALIKGDLRILMNFSDDAGHDETDADKEKEKEKEKSGSKCGARGMFSRAFFGEDKQDSQSSASKEEAEEKEPKTPPDSDKDASSSSPAEILSISITLPQKSAARKRQDVSDEQQRHGSTEESTSGSSSPILLEKESPRPTKRRKGNKKA
jgi:minor histocompatibility antigen H13